MKTVFQYNTLQERDAILKEHSNLVLIEEQNITNGNFLVLSDNPTEDKNQMIYGNTPVEEFTKMQIDNITLKQQLEQTNKDFVEFMDFYFSNTPGV